MTFRGNRHGGATDAVIEDGSIIIDNIFDWSVCFEYEFSLRHFQDFFDDTVKASRVQRVAVLELDKLCDPANPWELW